MSKPATAEQRYEITNPEVREKVVASNRDAYLNCHAIAAQHEARAHAANEAHRRKVERATALKKELAALEHDIEDLENVRRDAIHAAEDQRDLAEGYGLAVTLLGGTLPPIPQSGDPLDPSTPMPRLAAVPTPASA